MPSMRFSASISILVLLACCSQPSQEARDYAEFIKQRNDRLGQALILHGRLLESFSANKDVLSSDDFIAAEEILEQKLSAAGTVAELKGLSLPSEDREIAELHRLFVDTATYLHASVNSVADGGYSLLYFIKAEKQWDAARDSYLKFSKRLFSLVGEPPPIANTDG